MCHCLQLNTVSFRPCAVSQHCCPTSNPFLTYCSPQCSWRFLWPEHTECWLGKKTIFSQGQKEEFPVKCCTGLVPSMLGKLVVRNKRSCITDRVCAPSVVFGVEFLTSKMFDDFLFHVCISGKDFWKRNSLLASRSTSEQSYAWITVTEGSSVLKVSLPHPALCFRNLSSVAALRDDAQLLCMINNFEMFLDFSAQVPTAES